MHQLRSDGVVSEIGLYFFLNVRHTMHVTPEYTKCDTPPRLVCNIFLFFALI